MPTTVSPRILIVDDEVEITEILADLLSEEYECLKAGSAEDALARLGEGEFQLVISDITMPGMSGLEMIPHVKQLSPQTVVVMITAHGSEKIAVKSMEPEFVGSVCAAACSTVTEGGLSTTKSALP